MAALTQPAAATANTAGAIKFTFPSVSIGFYWTISVMVPLAPAGAVFTLYENGRPLFSWLGGNASSTLQVPGGSTISVSGSGLGATKQYEAIARGAINEGEAPGQPVSSLAAFTSISSTTSTVKVSIVNYLPTLGTKLLSVRVALLGLSTPVQLPAFILFLGVSLGWTPTNTGKKIYSLGASSVSVNSAAISTAVPVIGWQVANANEVWVLGTTGDHVNVAGE